MLNGAQIVSIPYDTQFSRGGVQYAQLSLHYTYNRMGLDLAPRLRKIVVGVAFEMAFRRWLESQQIVYDRLGATDFKERDRYDIGVGGRRCDLKCSLIDNIRHQRAIQEQVTWFLDCSALVPIDQFISQSLGERDIYVFGFLVGKEARNIEQTREQYRLTSESYLIYPLQAAPWCKPSHWQPLSPLLLKSKLAEPITVTVGGLDQERQPIRETLTLLPRQRTPLTQTFYSVLYLHVDRQPEDVIALYSQTLDDLQLVASFDWHNIWLYGRQVYLAGWLAKQEFRAKSHQLLAGSATKQYPSTKTHNRAMLVQDLRPMAQLVRLYGNAA